MRQKSNSGALTDPETLAMLQKSNKRLSRSPLSSLLARPDRFASFSRRLDGLLFDTEILPDIQAALRQGGWAVTVAVHKQRDVIAVWPGFKPDLYGLAVDIGSTTIAAHLCNLASGDVIATSGIMNAQIR